MTAPVPLEELARVKTVPWKVARRVAVATLVACVLVVALVAPAGASTGVLANEKFKWFYWIGFLLGASLIGVIVAFGVGYYMKLVRPRMRGRRVS